MIVFLVMALNFDTVLWGLALPESTREPNARRAPQASEGKRSPSQATTSIFGEVPAEVAEPFDPYRGGLTRSWLQDEVVNFDGVPQTATLPRRYAFRFVKVTVISCSKHGRFGFSDIHAEADTGAGQTSNDGRVEAHVEGDVIPSRLGHLTGETTSNTILSIHNRDELTIGRATASCLSRTSSLACCRL